MRIINPGEVSNRELYQYLIGSVTPRPIAFVSSINAKGQTNLAPYSFFNVFSVDPPVAIFSTARRGPDFSYKDTLNNIRETGECVINIVNYDIVRQMAVAACSFPPEQSEFDATGLSPIPSDLVKAPRVAESPIHLECRLREIIALGAPDKANQLVLCDILRLHIKEDIIDERNRIDPQKLDAMGRLGRAYYTRVSGEAIHTILQKQTPIPIGFANLPTSAKSSEILTGNDLGRLAGIITAPSEKRISQLAQGGDFQNLLSNQGDLKESLHQEARQLLKQDRVEEAADLVWLAAYFLDH